MQEADRSCHHGWDSASWEWMARRCRQAEVQLTLGGQQFPITVLVVSPLTTEAILGLDFLQHKSSVIDLGRTVLLLGRGQATQVPLVKAPRPATKIGVHLVDTVHIPPCSEVLVQEHTTVTDSKGAYLVESTGEQVGALVEEH